MSPSRLSRSAFSLIEVVIAVGLVAFCLVALMGLLAVSMNASRESTSTTAESMLFQKVINQLRVASINRNEPTDADDRMDVFPLPIPGQVGKQTFTVDSSNRYLGDGADVRNPKAARVVTVQIMDAAPFLQSHPYDPPSLSAGAEGGGNLAVVRVSIQSAQGYSTTKSGPEVSSFVTEINLAAQ